MIHLAQTALVDVLLDEIYAVVEAVDHADVQRLAGFVLHALHLQRLGIRPRGRLFAQHVLARPQRVHRDHGMHVVRRADRNGDHLRVVQNRVVIRDRLSAAVFLHSRLRALGEDVAEILDLRLGVFQIRGNVRRIRDRSAANDADLHGINLLKDFLLL